MCMNTICMISSCIHFMKTAYISTIVNNYILRAVIFSHSNLGPEED